jgi:acetyltransferase-like isoleucine patch superfamily enzyme
MQDTDHEYQDLSMSVGKQPLMIKKTQIGENCFIGSGAKIQAGTILGRHCVVGSNAVVRGTFPDYSVIVGAPARIVKRYDEKSQKWKKTNNKGEFIDEI